MSALSLAANLILVCDDSLLLHVLFFPWHCVLCTFDIGVGLLLFFVVEFLYYMCFSRTENIVA